MNKQKIIFCLAIFIMSSLMGCNKNMKEAMKNDDQKIKFSDKMTNSQRIDVVIKRVKLESLVRDVKNQSYYIIKNVNKLENVIEGYKTTSGNKNEVLSKFKCEYMKTRKKFKKLAYEDINDTFCENEELRKALIDLKQLNRNLLYNYIHAGVFLTPSEDELHDLDITTTKYTNENKTKIDKQFKIVENALDKINLSEEKKKDEKNI